MTTQWVRDHISQASQAFQEKRDRTALKRLLEVLSVYPSENSTLRIAGRVLKANMSTSYRKTSKEPLTPAQMDDPRLNGLFCSCDICGNEWISARVQEPDHEHIDVRNPIGGQCAKCGKYFCRAHFGAAGACPQCGIVLDSAPPANGRRSGQTIRLNKPLVHVLVLKEGSAPQGSALQELFESVAPDVLEDSPTISCTPTGNEWPDDAKDVALAILARGHERLSKDHDVYTTELRKSDGTRLVMLKVFANRPKIVDPTATAQQTNTASAPPNAGPSGQTVRLNKPLVHVLVWKEASAATPTRALWEFVESVAPDVLENSPKMTCNPYADRFPEKPGDFVLPELAGDHPEYLGKEYDVRTDVLRHKDGTRVAIVKVFANHPKTDTAQSAFHYTFSDAHLAVYGVFELQVLEEVLRRTNGAAAESLLRSAGEKIRRKIGWTGDVDQELLFLKDFYTAQRAYLERRQLFDPTPPAQQTNTANAPASAQKKNSGWLDKIKAFVTGPAAGQPSAARPAWASDAGRDKFGLWAEFTLGNVRQRMRWIEPGKFLMGSPEGEAGRVDTEGPQHEVRLTKGFWLGDTPVTQALWTAVMGNNPSRPQDPKRPVENVTWNEAQQFLNKMNARIPGLGLGLPSEAQWEYACRAGAEGPNYTGDAGKLADIAWFYGNSRQTQPVSAKRCNDWGLYDMLGNVLEWCADGRRSYAAKPVTDPVGPLDSVACVLRGGCWAMEAYCARAAYRLELNRGSLLDGGIGFRCCAEALEDSCKQQEAAKGHAAKAPGWLDKAGASVAPVARETRAVARPSWASDAEQDKFGLWAEFVLGNVRQRMRWIEPGTFLMGSPNDEDGRWDNEGPQHRVRLTKGFWLGDTPVTQALWTAVMGSNPSSFTGPKRPVERVNWDDAQEFLKKVNALIPGLGLGLPTEAQWEYACRAGSKGANYARGGQTLANIAWLAENSGDQTQPVAAKPCNDWGLYDMLGNVWEWCADGRRSYTAGPVIDPVGSLDGASRALRGGSWGGYARYMRAALRFESDPGLRDYSFGFRCCA